MKRVGRQRLGADAWRELLAKFADSGLSVRAFCGQQGISASTFNWWRSRLRGSSAARPAVSRNSVPTGEFVDLGTLKALASPPERIELRLDLGGGLIVHLVRG